MSTLDDLIRRGESLDIGDECSTRSFLEDVNLLAHSDWDAYLGLVRYMKSTRDVDLESENVLPAWLREAFQLANAKTLEQT